MVFAEIYEEAGAFTRFMIKETIHILLPDETEFNAFNFAEKIEAAKFNGDKVRLAQLLTAEVRYFKILKSSERVTHNC